MVRDNLSLGNVTIDFAVLDRAKQAVRALNHPLRAEMLKLIQERTKANVTEIYVKLRIEQSVASQHLAILRRANAVKTERDGKTIWYTINHQRIAELMDVLHELPK